MRFLKLRLPQRLLLSLALSFSVVLSVVLIEWRREENWPDEAGFAFILIAVGVFLTLSTINQYLNETSTGWKRLSVVSSVVISGFIGVYVYNDSSYSRQNEEALQVFFFALPVSFMILLYSKAIFIWVKDGFKSDSL